MPVLEVSQGSSHSQFPGAGGASTANGVCGMVTLELCSAQPTQLLHGAPNVFCASTKFCAGYVISLGGIVS